MTQYPVKATVINTANGLLGLNSDAEINNAQIPSTICRTVDHYTKSEVDSFLQNEMNVDMDKINDFLPSAPRANNINTGNITYS